MKSTIKAMSQAVKAFTEVFNCDVATPVVQALLEAIKREEAQTLNPTPEDIVSGALFDFLGFCTSREEELHLSGHHDAGKVVEALQIWAKTRNLNLNEARVKDWELFINPISVKQSADMLATDV